MNEKQRFKFVSFGNIAFWFETVCVLIYYNNFYSTTSFFFFFLMSLAVSACHFKEISNL